MVWLLGHNYCWDHVVESVKPSLKIILALGHHEVWGWIPCATVTFLSPLFSPPQFQLQSLQIACNSLGAEEDRCCDLPALVRQEGWLC